MGGVRWVALGLIAGRRAAEVRLAAAKSSGPGLDPPEQRHRDQPEVPALVALSFPAERTRIDGCAHVPVRPSSAE